MKAKSFHFWAPAFILLLILGFFSAPVYATRIPSPKKTESVASRFFKSYGKKYKETVFAGKNIDKLSVNGVEEISLNMIYADLIVSFKDAQMMRVIVRMRKKFPGGWRVVSWENLGVR